MIQAQYDEFQRLADKCLMTLKLEARTQCYYYLTLLMQKVRLLESESALCAALLELLSHVVKANSAKVIIDHSLLWCLEPRLCSLCSTWIPRPRGRTTTSSDSTRC